MIYNTHLTRYKRLFFAPVQYTKENDMFFALDPPNHVIFNKEVNKRHQKNWSPFDFCPRCDFMDGMAINATSINEEDKGLDRKSFSPHLLMVYSLNPHRIVQTYPCDDCLQRNGTSPVSDYNAEVVFSSKLLPEYEWKWGEMRGGTPALKFGDKYLAFFHSSGKLSHPSVLTYVMGAYMFES